MFAGYDTVETPQRSNRIMPPAPYEISYGENALGYLHLSPLTCRHSWERWVLETMHSQYSHFWVSDELWSMFTRNRDMVRDYQPSTVAELHDVERSSAHGWIFAARRGSWDWYIRTMKSMDNSIFTLDLVSGLGQQFAWRFLPEDISAAIAGGDLISRV